MGRKPINNKTLTCPQCNCEFTVKEYSNRIYCSDKCSREHWTGSRKNSRNMEEEIILKNKC
jgi:uncharacterized Zn ribbon protein